MNGQLATDMAIGDLRSAAAQGQENPSEIIPDSIVAVPTATRRRSS